MYIALDIETTGFDRIENDIIEVAMILFNDENKILDEYNTLIKTNKEIPELITQITGIKNEDLKNAPYLEEVKEKIEKFLNNYPIVGHNIEFDINFLKAKGLMFSNNHYDTLFLSSAILKNIKSYSLETLSKVLGIEHINKHNAYDDAKASMSLFLYLKEKFEELPANIIEEITKISDKSDIEIKEFFKNLKTKNKVVVKTTKEKPEETEDINKEYKFETNSLNETTTDYLHLLKHFIKEKNVCISVPKKLFDKVFDYPEIKTKKIDRYSGYLNENRLNKILTKNSFENYEAKALIKILIWLSEGNDRLLSSLKLFNEEKKIINEINNTEKETKEEAKENETFICSHDYLISEKTKADKTIIMDINDWRFSLERSESIFLTLEKTIAPLNILGIKHVDNPTINALLQKTTILFAQMGIIFDKTKTLQNLVSVELNNNVLKSLDWSRLSESLSNLIKLSENLIEIVNDENLPELRKWKENLIYLSKIFHENPFLNFSIYLEQQFDNSPAIKAVSNDLNKKTSDIFSQFKEYIIIDNSLNLNDKGEFSKRYFNLPKDINFALKDNFSKNLFLELTPTKEDKQLEKIIEIINQNEKNTAIIVNSRILMKKLTLELNKNIKNKILISETFGSIGKINEMFDHIDTNGLLILSPQSLSKIETPEKIQSLIIPKIPFAYSKSSNEGFMTHTLPLSALRLKRLINTIKPSKNEQKTAYLLDERILNKNYGEKFINMLTTSFSVIS